MPTPTGYNFENNSTPDLLAPIDAQNEETPIAAPESQPSDNSETSTNTSEAGAFNQFEAQLKQNMDELSKQMSSLEEESRAADERLAEDIERYSQICADIDRKRREVISPAVDELKKLAEQLDAKVDQFPKLEAGDRGFQEGEVFKVIVKATRDTVEIVKADVDARANQLGAQIAKNTQAIHGMNTSMAAPDNISNFQAFKHDKEEKPDPIGWQNLAKAA